MSANKAMKMSPADHDFYTEKMNDAYRSYQSKDDDVTILKDDIRKLFDARKALSPSDEASVTPTPLVQAETLNEPITEITSNLLDTKKQQIYRNPSSAEQAAVPASAPPPSAASEGQPTNEGALTNTVQPQSSTANAAAQQTAQELSRTQPSPSVRDLKGDEIGRPIYSVNNNEELLALFDNIKQMVMNGELNQISIGYEKDGNNEVLTIDIDIFRKDPTNFLKNMSHVLNGASWPIKIMLNSDVYIPPITPQIKDSSATAPVAQVVPTITASAPAPAPAPTKLEAYIAQRINQQSNLRMKEYTGSSLGFTGQEKIDAAKALNYWVQNNPNQTLTLTIKQHKALTEFRSDLSKIAGPILDLAKKAGKLELVKEPGKWNIRKIRQALINMKKDSSINVKDETIKNLNKLGP